MNPRIADRLNQVAPSLTMSISAQAMAMREQGDDVIVLSQGEPDFPTPSFVVEAAHRAMQEGRTGYTAATGMASLKEAVCEKMQRDHGVSYHNEQCLITCGGKQAVYNLTQVLLQSGDEAIVPAPYWVSYVDMVHLTGAKPVIVPTDASSHYKITAEKLREVLSPQTRLLFLNTPNNPSGQCFNEAELKSLAGVLLQHPNVIIASDDIYEHIYWGAHPLARLLRVCPELADRTVLINGVAKAYAMTGWRIGYAAGPKWLLKAMGTLQSHSTSNACTISQWAALAAITGDQSVVQQYCESFQQRHQWVHHALQSLPGVSCLPSEGTFYCLPDVTNTINRLQKIKNDVEFAAYLLSETGVALVPGSAFGAPGHLRLSFASSEEVLHSALSRIKRCFNEIHS